MNLVTRQIYGRKGISVSVNTEIGGVSVNTEIGGVSASIGTAELLATKLAIDVSRITAFSVLGSDIKCKITGSYTVIGFENRTDITSYYDYDGLITSVGTQAFNNCQKVDFLWFPNCLSVGVASLALLGVFSTIYIPRCSSIGLTSASDSVFGGTPHPAKLYCHPSTQTNNGGSPDGDVSDFIALGGTVSYVSNFTAPNSITDLTIGTVYSTALQLNFTPPTGSANLIDYYECYVNGVFKNTIYGSGAYITGLTAETLYSITLKPVDVFYNKSSSNTFSQTTSAVLVWQDSLISYYKMENNVFDSWGTNHGKSTSIVYQSGLVGNAIKLNGTSSFVDLKLNSLVGGKTAFSIAFNFKMGAVKNSNALIGAWGSSAGTYSFICWISGGQLAFYTYTTNGQQGGSVFPMSDLDNHIAVFTYDGVVMKSYLDGVVSAVTYTQTGAVVSSVETVKIGKLTSGNAYGNSAVDEVGFFNKALNTSDVSAITSKLQSGQSLI